MSLLLLPAVAEETRIIYGGSVKGSNCKYVIIAHTNITKTTPARQCHRHLYCRIFNSSFDYYLQSPHRMPQHRRVPRRWSISPTRVCRHHEGERRSCLCARIQHTSIYNHFLTFLMPAVHRLKNIQDSLPHGGGRTLFIVIQLHPLSCT